MMATLLGTFLILLILLVITGCVFAAIKVHEFMCYHELYEAATILFLLIVVVVGVCCMGHDLGHYILTTKH